MSFTLVSRFTIGKYRFHGCNDINIKKSIHEIVQKATLKIPTSAVIRQANPTTASVQTAKTFAIGDKVTIELGYNNVLREEFIGFVSALNLKTPTEIEMEGYSYQLRVKKNIKKSWSSTTLKEVLQFLIKDTDISLHPDIPDMPLKNIVINNATGLQVIDYIKDLLKGALTAFFIGNTLYMGLTYYDTAKTTVKHRIGWNVKDANDLKYKKADDTPVTIEIKCRKPSGEQVTTTQGAKGGVVKTNTISTVVDVKHLNDIAKALLLQKSFDGYEGSITSLLVPYCQPGYRSELSDRKYPDRGGNYFAESTEVTFNTSGATRRIGIGIKLSS
jgi:hypothetical protein